MQKKDIFSIVDIGRSDLNDPSLFRCFVEWVIRFMWWVCFCCWCWCCFVVGGDVGVVVGDVVVVVVLLLVLLLVMLLLLLCCCW